MQAAARAAGLRASSSSSTASFGVPEGTSAEGVAGGRLGSGQLGLERSGRISAELRQSSSGEQTMELQPVFMPGVISAGLLLLQ